MVNKKSEIILDEKTDVDFEPEFKASIPIIDLLKDKEAVDAIERLVMSIMTNSRKNAVSERWFQGIGVVALIAAVSVLSFFDRMTPSAGVIFGALAGYLFGKGTE